VRTLVLGLFASFSILVCSHVGAADVCHNGFLSAEKVLSGSVWSAAWGDFDGDGRADVAIVSQYSHLTVLLNRGNRVFESVSVADFVFTAQLFAAEDVNGDGKIDLIFHAPQSTGLWVVLGRGDGTFGPPIASTVNGSSTWRFVDINGDGRKDVVEGDGQRVYVSLSHGDGHFDSPALAASILGVGPNQFAVGDFDGDGHTDLFFMGSQNTTTRQTIWWNDGKGAFPTDTETTFDARTTEDFILDAWDFDGDGAADLLFRDQTGATQLLSAKNRTITIRPATLSSSIRNASAARLTGIADFDGDGAADALFEDGTVIWGPPSGTQIDGSRFDVIRYNVASFALNYGAHVADVNGDGIPDIAGTGSAEGLFVAYGQAHSRHLPGGSFVLPSANVVAPAFADINGDGIVDVVVALGTQVITYFGDSHGGFTSSAVSALATPIAAGPLFLGDLDGDGRTDLLYWGTDTTTHAVFGDGTGKFASPVSVGSQGVGLIVGTGRINASGKSGAYIFTPSSLSLVTFSNRAPVFTTVADTSSDTSVVLVDADLDGLTDVIISSSFGPASLIRRTTTGWAAPLQLTLSARAKFATVLDFNGDGRPDLFTCGDLGSCSLSLWNGTAYQSGQSPFSSSPFGSSIQGLLTTDLDRDGRPDLIAITAENTLTIFAERNLGGGLFDESVANSTFASAFLVDESGSGLPTLLLAGPALKVLDGGCVSQPIHIAVRPAIVHAGEKASVVINVEPPSGFTWNVTLREGSSAIARSDQSQWSATYNLRSLTPGVHVFTATAGPYATETFTIDVPQPTPRKRAVRH